ncbi:BamA/TamA family outer membrane protein [Aquirufa ecclesiirivi]|uniref:translocation and assembly module lipoprotein TamL n=1 Tax=Aquirufa ecclesiirivi TaxID=2715124 RepID=UPI003BB180A6
MKSRNILVGLVIVQALFISCTGYRQFKFSEYKVNRIEIQGNQLISKEDLRTNIPGLKESYARIFSPRVYGFFEAKRKLKDSLGKSPAFIQLFSTPNPSLNKPYLDITKEAIFKYYRNNGFLKNKVFLKIDTINSTEKLVNVTYTIEENEVSTFSKMDSFLVDNPLLGKKIETYYSKESVISNNDRLNLDLLKKEKDNISHYLKNQGYFYFSNEAIGLKLNDLQDTSLLRVGIIYKIPDFKEVNTNRLYDRLFRFGRATFVNNQYTDSSNIGVLNTNALSKLITFKEGDLYSVDQLNQSLQNIYASDQFKSVSIKFDTSSTRVFPKVELVPNEKFNFSSELGGSVFRGIPGPFLTNSFKIRRVFSSLDYLDFSARVGFEAQAGFINTDQARKNLEVNLSTTLNFPKLFLPANIKQQLGSLYASQTQIGFGYDYINRPEYLRTNFKIFQRYQWRKSPFKTFQFSLVDLNILNTNYPETSTASAFKGYLEELRLQGNNLYRSFNPSFVSSIHFTYAYRSFLPSNELQAGESFQLGLESGGSTLNLIGSKKITFIENLLGSDQNIQFYRFLRFNFDYRKYKMLGLNRKAQLAFKFIGGLAYAYGEENDFQLPYEKNFFIGGPSSLRAWKPRRLGPGAYNSISNLIEQPGSILLESSVEYRFRMFQLFGTMNGAFFIDAGNIWTFANSKGEKDGYFAFDNFYNQIAVGTGFGLRWDFSYFLLRLDLATKVINPAKPVNEKWVLSKTSFSSGENPIEFNIGIGYPF